MAMIRRHPRATLLATITALFVPLVLASPASAVAPAAAPDANSGWVRLGHFSPDTKDVDVRVTALSGGSIVLDLNDVGYGDVSAYSSLATGTYTVAMVAAGSDTWDSPVLSAKLTVDPGTAATVAAYGPNRDLQVRAFPDDLTAPAGGAARIRLIQASTITPTVDVRTTTGVTIARKARAGSVTPYTEVPAGPWTFQLTGEGVSDTAVVDAPAGSIATLFVLDTADGGLTILPVLDGAAAPVVPDGGVQTGGGWLGITQGSDQPVRVGGGRTIFAV
jgi:hypothetical protein